jgi:hypothetical protein
MRAARKLRPHPEEVAKATVSKDGNEHGDATYRTT